MSRILHAVLLSVLMLGLGMTSGCESKPKVNVSAQITALDGTAEAKQEALSQLATVGPAAAPAVPKLTELLKDPDPVVRRLSAYALGEIGPAAKSAVPTMKAALDNADREFATGLVNALRAVDPAAAKSMGL
jgi:HEAT repeat protein